MTRREELIEQYEDALFAQMMKCLTVMLGVKALEENKRLKRKPKAAIPEKVHRRCIQTIMERCIS